MVTLKLLYANGLGNSY